VAGQAAGTVRDTAAAAYERTADAAEYAGEELTGMVRRYPITSVLIGFGVGFLFGRMIRNT
jgi:ElaB/YqjD/DUF883 family membrane-anchored ribosome-binding protein